MDGCLEGHGDACASCDPHDPPVRAESDSTISRRNGLSTMHRVAIALVATLSHDPPVAALGMNEMVAQKGRITSCLTPKT